MMAVLADYRDRFCGGYPTLAHRRIFLSSCNVHVFSCRDGDERFTRSAIGLFQFPIQSSIRPRINVLNGGNDSPCMLFGQFLSVCSIESFQ